MKTENGKRKTENGERKTENGERKTESDEKEEYYNNVFCGCRGSRVRGMR